MDEEVFRALADPSRRALLDRLFERDGQTLTELERALPAMTRFGVMKHLRILEAAELVVSRKVGRERHHYLNPVPIQEIHGRWLDKYRARAAATLIELRSMLEGPPMHTESTAQTGSTGAAHVDGADRPPAHVYTIFIRTTPEQLWRALTESEFTTNYFFASTVESDWLPGSPYAYRIGEELAIQGQVLEADAPRRLTMTFDARWDESVTPDPPSRVAYEIEAAAPGVCKLTVVHDGFARRDATYEQVGGGTPYILSGLKTLLETGSALATAPSS